MVNNCEYILHKVAHKKGKRHDYDVYKENHPVIPKQVVTIFDLEDTLIWKKTIQNNYHPYRKERRETKEGYMRKKKSTTEFILKKENIVICSIPFVD
jgi:hypothetical protein